MSGITLSLICKVACEYSGFSLDDLRSDRRHADLVLVRQHAIWLGCELTEQSMPQIGRFFGRDHTTILHAYRKITGLRASDETFRGLSDELMMTVKATAQSVEALLEIVPPDVDVLALARKFLAHPRTVFTASTEEIQALAAATIAGAKEADALVGRSNALAVAVSQYLKSHEARNAETRAERLEAGAHILAARNHLKHKLQQWRGHHGDEDDESEKSECAGSGLDR